jgi:hypothetical protein
MEPGDQVAAAREVAAGSFAGRDVTQIPARRETDQLALIPPDEPPGGEDEHETDEKPSALPRTHRLETVAKRRRFPKHVPRALSRTD